jgi:glycosyltransferase involved in cell wall biosynthesis
VKNRGVAAARNIGIEQTQGSLIAFLDADDIWLPTKLERQVQRLGAKRSTGACLTAGTRIDAAGKPLEPMPLTHTTDISRAVLLGFMRLGAGITSGCVRRPLLRTLGGFDTRFSQCADLDLWLRLGLETEFRGHPDTGPTTRDRDR